MQVMPPAPPPAPALLLPPAAVSPLLLAADVLSLLLPPPLEPQAARAIELAAATSAAIEIRRVRLTTFTILRAGV